MGSVSRELALAHQIEQASSSSADVMEEPELLPRAYDLAYHFDAAGEKRKAWIYGLLAAEQAKRQFALGVAAEQYAISNRNLEGASDDVRYRIAKGWGQTLMLLGRYDQASEQLGSAIDLSENAEKKAHIELLQSELACKQGQIDKSIETLESSLRRLSYRVPRTSVGIVSSVVRESAMQCVYSLLPVLRRGQKPDSRLELIVRILTLAGNPYAFRSTLSFVWATLGAMNRVDVLPRSILTSKTYAFHAVTTSLLGWDSRAKAFGKRSVDIARELNDLFAIGQSCNYLGIGNYVAARYEDGLFHLGEAIEAYEGAGDFWELHLARFHRGCCHFGIGALDKAIAEARWTFDSSARMGDSRTLCSSYLWARATRGNIPFEGLKSCYPCRPDDVMSTAHGVMAEGHWHTFHGRTEEALQAFERANKMIWKSHCVNAHTIMILPNLAGALRVHADATQAKDPQQTDHLRRRASRVAKWATWITRFVPAAYPQSLRERSLILLARGKLKSALRFADRSCAVAEAQQAKFEYAQSEVARADIRRQLGIQGADDELETAQAELNKFTRMAEEASQLPAS